MTPASPYNLLGKPGGYSAASRYYLPEEERWMADLIQPTAPAVSLTPVPGLPGAADQANWAEAVKRAGRRELATNLAISGGLGLAQLGAQFIPTAADIYAKESEEYLKKHKGELAPDVAEQLKATDVGLAMQSAERARAGQALQTSLGNQSAAAQMRPGREAARADIDAAIKQGQVKAAAKGAQWAADEALEAQLAERKGEKQAAKIGAVLNLAGGIAGAIAQSRGGRLSPSLDMGKLQAIPNAADRARVLQVVQGAKSPAEQEALIQLLGLASA